MAATFCGIVKVLQKLHLPRVSLTRGIHGETFPPEGKVPKIPTLVPWTKNHKSHPLRKYPFPPEKFKGQALQDWWDWNGFGPYKYRYHDYPTNITLRDVQRRRIFKLHHEERNRTASIFRNQILPKELRDLAADKEIHQIPRDSAITRINRRCALTGKARGIFHQYRVSRFIFRLEADYNKISGVMRAKWMYSTKIEP